ncbi:O-antigen polymerase, partial [Escherichia coli]
MNIKKDKFINGVLFFWLIISSLYYLNAIFSGVDTLKYNEDLTQKIIKYIVCLV